MTQRENDLIVRNLLMSISLVTTWSLAENVAVDIIIKYE